MSLKLKLKVNTGAGSSTGIGAAQSPATPATPAVATPGGSVRPKFKITNKSTPSTPIAPAEQPKPKKSKAGRASKPSAKLVESKKREREESEDDQTTRGTIAVQPPLPKKVKLNFGLKTPKTPVPQTPIDRNGGIKAKIKGKPKLRIPGDGYDSEASDNEIDPMVEEEYILRLLPGDDCDFFRQTINEKRMGIPISAGGPDIQMKYFGPDARRAAITIRGRCYAAVLVDLPTILEGMKSWDKRGWWKSADICQMLWVFAPIKKEEEAKTFPLPKGVDPKTYAYPHGITPPMHFARKRRFRKRVSRTAIEAVERTVQRLLEEDAKAMSSKWEMIDENAERRSQMYSPAPGSSPGGDNDEDEYSEDEDAEGEEDDASQQQPGYFNTAHHNEEGEEEEEEEDLDLIAEMEAELEAGRNEASTPMSTTAATPLPSGENAGLVPEEEDSGDESIEGDDDDGDDDEEEMDEEEKARLVEIDGIKEDIADLEKKIENAQAQIATQQNPILKRRLEDNARKLKAELQIKKSSIGEGDGSNEY